MDSALTDASCRTSVGPSDLYNLTLPPAGTVDLEIDSGVFDTILAVRGRRDNLIVRDEEVNGLRVAHVIADLPAGVYTVPNSVLLSEPKARCDRVKRRQGVVGGQYKKAPSSNKNTRPRRRGLFWSQRSASSTSSLRSYAPEGNAISSWI
jgi:hypothetical protein